MPTNPVVYLPRKSRNEFVQRGISPKSSCWMEENDAKPWDLGFFFGVPPWFLDTWQPWFFPWFVPQFQRFAWSMASLQDSAIFMALTRNRLKPTKASEVGLVWDRNFLHRLYLHESWHTSVGATGSKLKTWDEAEVALAPRDLDSFSKSQYPKKTTEVGFFAFGHRLQPCHPC